MEMLMSILQLFRDFFNLLNHTAEKDFIYGNEITVYLFIYILFILFIIYFYLFIYLFIYSSSQLFSYSKAL